MLVKRELNRGIGHGNFEIVYPNVIVLNRKCTHYFLVSLNAYAQNQLNFNVPTNRT